MIEKLPCHDEIVYEIQRAIQTFGPLTAQSLSLIHISEPTRPY